MFKKTEFNDKYMNHFRLEFGIQTRCLYNNKDCIIYNIHLNDVSIQNRYTQLNSIKQILLEAKTCIHVGDFNQIYQDYKVL